MLWTDYWDETWYSTQSSAVELKIIMDVENFWIVLRTLWTNISLSLMKCQNIIKTSLSS